MDYEQLAQREVVEYWRAILGTLKQRNLLKQRPQAGGYVVPQALAILDKDRAYFVMDMLRLGGIARERWLDRDLWHQWRAALSGRRVCVADGYGLVIVVGRTPGLPNAKRLPAMIPLTLECIPDGLYTVTLGQSKRGPVVLDLAGSERAILCGGAPGGGKSNLMQSIILQLCAKHGPGELKVAIVDTKEVDFGPTFERLPHLLMPVAHTMDAATALIGAIEQERQRRQAVMASEGVNHWRKLAEPFPLLLTTIDEAADFAKTAAMEILVESARKGRAMGCSFIVGTQLPSAKVIDPQVRAALETAIAFRCRTHLESQAIIGTGGAEKLDRPGLALAYLRGKWVTAQTLLVDDDSGGDLADTVAVPLAPALEPVEVELVTFALEDLGGRFIINRLAEQFAGQVSRRQIVKLAKRWELRGWLTTPAHATDARRITEELAGLAGGGLPPAQSTENGHTVTGETGGHRDLETVTGAGNRASEVVTGPMTGAMRAGVGFPVPTFS